MSRMQHAWLVLGVLLAAAGHRCTQAPTQHAEGGGGTETVIGKIVNVAGDSVPDASIQLVPRGYNPVLDGALPDSLTAKSDSTGAFVIQSPLPGKYNIEARDAARDGMAFVSGVTVVTDTLDVGDLILQSPGAVAVTLPASAVAADGYVYIGGTTIKERVTDAALADGYVVIDSVPASGLPATYYVRQSGDEEPVLLLDSAIVAAGDTTVFTSWDGVPDINPDYASTVDAWWSAHPFNPASPNHNAAIMSPAPVVDVASGGDIQAALDGLPAAGGTVRLASGTYAGTFTIVGRSNVHIVCEGSAVVNTSFSQVVACSTALDYGTFDNCIWTGDADCWACLRNPTRNYYFKNIIFDGGGTELRAVSFGNVDDVVFDSCTFANYADPDTGLDGMVVTYMGCDNMWFLGCTFLGRQRYAVRFTGNQGSGMVGCHVDSAFGSGGFAFVANSDFSDDLDSSGALEPVEARDSKYSVVSGCTFAGTHATVGQTGGHFLYENNTIGWADQCVIVYGVIDAANAQSFAVSDIVCRSNTVGELYTAFLHMDNALGASVYGGYTARCNTIRALDTLGGAQLIVESGTVSGPNTVEGNCVNDSTCVPCN
ncbi:MAG: hypothetical protein GF418_14660 [Chitinivibrionales bacterium]|nr:hypothetical protein [Chitinivibrionales bacterium]MBD3396861.1 hypothetical protein [Chitinivibrionales bacterium]